MLVDLDALPSGFPTHRHAPLFWEKLGPHGSDVRLPGGGGGQSHLRVHSEKRNAEADSEAAFEAWLRNPEGLERALTDPLAGLIDQFERAVQEYSDGGTSEIEDLLDHLRKASGMRNVLCHGSWGIPDETGASKPLFVERKGETMFDMAVDGAFLDQVRQHVVDLACAVINQVTNMGWQFPGSLGPGRPVLDR